MVASSGEFPKTDGEPLSATDVHYTGDIISVNAGEDIDAGEVVFVRMTGHTDEGDAELSDADTQDLCRATGIALETKTDGNEIKVMTRGVYQTTGLTANKDYYLSTTAGGLSLTRSGVKIGFSLSATELYIDIVQDDRDVVGTVKPYLKSITGLPSNNLTAFWVEANGQTLSDDESPLDTQTIPDLNGYTGAQRFLRGGGSSDGSTPVASGADGGTEEHAHTLSTTTHSLGTSGSFSHITSATTSTVGTLPSYYEVAYIMKVK